MKFTCHYCLKEYNRNKYIELIAHKGNGKKVVVIFCSFDCIYDDVIDAGNDLGRGSTLDVIAREECQLNFQESKRFNGDDQ